ncbi:MAG TPA: AAA family ATPase, partial [Casimicrobiaceae bacterium]|nr:AAA family ATPase [Casimicrobiaceae bacterium]
MNQSPPPLGIASPTERQPPSDSSGPLIGRGGELARLSAALQSAEGGHGGTFIITGESGIGKTRLATALIELAAKRNFAVAVGRAYPVETGVPYAIFSDALLPILRGIDPSALALLTRGGNAELVQLFPALGTGDRPVSTTGVRGEPAELRARLLWNFTQFLSRYAAKRPLLLVLENLQWADNSSIELLHFTARQIVGDRVLIVATCNDADPRAVEGQSAVRSLETSLVRLGVAQSMRLSSLDPAATQELVAQVLGDAPARELSEAIHQRTRGNPFFVEETLKALADAGAGRTPTAQDLQALKMPQTIRDVVV